LPEGRCRRWVLAGVEEDAVFLKLATPSALRE